MMNPRLRDWLAVLGISEALNQKLEEFGHRFQETKSFTERNSLNEEWLRLLAGTWEFIPSLFLTEKLCRVQKPKVERFLFWVMSSNRLDITPMEAPFKLNEPIDLRRAALSVMIRLGRGLSGTTSIQEVKPDGERSADLVISIGGVATINPRYAKRLAEDFGFSGPHNNEGWQEDFVKEFHTWLWNRDKYPALERRDGHPGLVFKKIDDETKQVVYPWGIFTVKKAGDVIISPNPERMERLNREMPEGFSRKET